MRLALAILGSSLFVACLAGCAGVGTTGNRFTAPLFSRGPFSNGASTRAEQEALKKAVERDPFPKANSRP